MPARGLNLDPSTHHHDMVFDIPQRRYSTFERGITVITLLHYVKINQSTLAIYKPFHPF
jgi:hypothetical protein